MEAVELFHIHVSPCAGVSATAQCGTFGFMATFDERTACVSLNVTVAKGRWDLAVLDDHIFLVGGGGGGAMYTFIKQQIVLKETGPLCSTWRHCGVHWWHHVQSCHSRVLLTQTVTRAITYLQQQLQGRCLRLCLHFLFFFFNVKCYVMSSLQQNKITYDAEMLWNGKKQGRLGRRNTCISPKNINMDAPNLVEWSRIRV